MDTARPTVEPLGSPTATSEVATPQVINIPPPQPPPNPGVPTQPPPAGPPPQSQNVFSNDTSSKSHTLKILALIIGLILFLSIGVGGVMAAVAYEKIKLNNPSLEKPITQFVMSLPFTPKTPRFLLEAVAQAHTKVSKHSFNVSLAAKSDNFSSNLGLSQVDAEAKGNVDYSNPQNLKTTLNVAVTKDFNADIRKNDSTVYLKVNKVPPLLLTAFKIDPEKIKPILDNWIAFESKRLDSQADKELDKNKSQKSLTAEYLTNTIDDLLDENLLPNIGISSDKQDGHQVYKLHLKADDQTVDNLINKIEQRAAGENAVKTRDLNVNRVPPSKYIKDLNIDLWIDQSNYFVRRISATFSYNPNYSASPTPVPSKVLGISTDVLGAQTILSAGPDLFSLGKSQTSFATVATFDDFGKDFQIETPSQSLKPEEYLQKVMAASETLSSAQTGARDSMRKADIQAISKALEVHYLATAGTCDNGVAQSAGTYCPLQDRWFAAGKIPTDPNKDWNYCIISGTGNGVIGNSTTGKCPVGWKLVSAGQPPANTILYTVCAYQEQATNGKTYYCSNSQRNF